MRGDEADGDETGQPTVGRLADLVDRVVEAGLPTTLRVDGTPRPLPEALDVSAFRIVQEALTNALKHAGGAAAEVVVRWSEDRIRLEVRDTGDGQHLPPVGGSGGRGLVGLRSASPSTEAACGLRPYPKAASSSPHRCRCAPDMTRLIIADDEELIRAGLRLILERETDLAVVAEAATDAEALRAQRETPADVVLMDLRMPGLDGVEATRQLVALGDRSPRVLVLTTFGSEDLVYTALKAGASGFLLKTTAPARLVEAVRAVAAGESLLSPEIMSGLIGRYVTADRRAWAGLPSWPASPNAKPRSCAPWAGGGRTRSSPPSCS